MVCAHCSLEFSGKRADAKFCSTKCRVAAIRYRQAVTDSRNTESVTDTAPLPTDPAALLAQYEILSITGEGVNLKIIAPKPAPRQCQCPQCGARFLADDATLSPHSAPKYLTKSRRAR